MAWGWGARDAAPSDEVTEKAVVRAARRAGVGRTRSDPERRTRGPVHEMAEHVVFDSEQGQRKNSGGGLTAACGTQIQILILETLRYQNLTLTLETVRYISPNPNP